ncbi:Voltage-dependent L-type calcium channel subunit alpha-1C, partial [Quaeritorhiza haematococci]
MGMWDSMATLTEEGHGSPDAGPSTVDMSSGGSQDTLATTDEDVQLGLGVPISAEPDSIIPVIRLSPFSPDAGDAVRSLNSSKRSSTSSSSSSPSSPSTTTECRKSVSWITKTESFMTKLSDSYKSTIFFHLVNRVSTSTTWGTLTFFIICLSCVALALDDPVEGTPTFERAIDIADIIFAVLFTLELLINIAGADALLWRERPPTSSTSSSSNDGYTPSHTTSSLYDNVPDPFLRNAGNWLDILLVVVSILAVTPAGNEVRVLRILRIARIFRLIRMHDGLRIVTVSMFRTIPTILGLNIFVGLGWQCNDPTVTTRSECIGTFIPTSPPPSFGDLPQSILSKFNATPSLWPPNSTLPSNGTAIAGGGEGGEGLKVVALGVPGFEVREEPRRWTQYRLPWDDFFDALLSTVVISFQEGWPDDARRFMDAAGEDLQPRRDANPGFYIFYAVTEMLGCWFFLAVVTGLVYDNMRRHTEVLRGLSHLSDYQKRAIAYLNFSYVYRPICLPVRTRAKWRRRLQELVIGTNFTRIMYLVVILDVFRISIVFKGAPTTMDQIRFIGDWLFTAIYTLEAVLTMTGVGPRAYFRNRWNVLNFTIVVVAWLELPLSLLNIGATLLMTLRLLRVIRTFRLLTGAKGLRALFMALMLNTIQLLNVLLLEFLTLFCFAVICMHFFGKLEI